MHAGRPATPEDLRAAGYVPAGERGATIVHVESERDAARAELERVKAELETARAKSYDSSGGYEVCHAPKPDGVPGDSNQPEQQGRNMHKVSRDDIEDVQVQLSSKVEELTQKFMREHGWVHTSSTPGCFWAWTKELPDGRLLMIHEMRGSSLPLEVASNLDEWLMQHPRSPDEVGALYDPLTDVGRIWAWFKEQPNQQGSVTISRDSYSWDVCDECDGSGRLPSGSECGCVAEMSVTPTSAGGGPERGSR